MLGAAWTVLQPLMLLGVYSLVFGFISTTGRVSVPYLLTGILPYLAISEAIGRAISALREDRALLDSEAFPAEILPVAKVVAASIPEVVGLVLLLAAMPLLDLPMTGWILTLPFIMVLRMILACGIVWIVSTLVIFVNDLTEVIQLLLTSWLFLTPIFYTFDNAPALLQRALILNPLYHVMQAYRQIIIEGRAPLSEGLLALASATLVAAVGLWFFRKTIDRTKDFL
jgi:ABC-type polysaccharide/polyol phosphate export permease